jgi:putative tricarboxylic transport membrane protein
VARKDLVSALLFICLAVYVCWQSFAMGFGGWTKPGAGVFPFLSGLGLGVVTIIMLLKSRFAKDAAETKPGKKAIPWKPFLITFGCLTGYILLIDTLGFTPTTFLFIGILLRTVGKRTWALSGSLGLGIALGAYLLFGFILQSQLPKGPFGIFGF